MVRKLCHSEEKGQKKPLEIYLGQIFFRALIFLGFFPDYKIIEERKKHIGILFQMYSNIPVNIHLGHSTDSEIVKGHSV